MSRQLRRAICESRAESTSWNPLCSIPNFAIHRVRALLGARQNEDSFMAKAKHKKKARSTGSEPVRIGVIGGSELYHMPRRQNAREIKVKTPFGDPSDALVVGTLEGKRVAFLARHARGHRFLPSEINYQANIHAMKQLGVERIISVSAVGSLQEDLKPLDFLIPDQFYDRTRHRISTFFGDGVIAHVGFEKPVCTQLSGILGAACDQAKVRVHRGGTYICMEGPQFSTLAASHVYRQLRFQVIGMTNLTEAKLAREAEICYSTVAMITDYDCWHPDHASVTAAEVMNNLKTNAQSAENVIRTAVRSLPAAHSCKCAVALQHAIVTDRAAIPAAAKRRRAAIVGKYLN